MIICKCSKSVSKFSIVNSCWLKCKHCSELNLLALISPHIRFSQLNNIVYKQRKNNFLRIFEAAIDTKKDKSLFAPHLVSSKFAFHSRFFSVKPILFTKTGSSLAYKVYKSWFLRLSCVNKKTRKRSGEKEKKRDEVLFWRRRRQILFTQSVQIWQNAQMNFCQWQNLTPVQFHTKDYV